MRYSNRAKKRIAVMLFVVFANELFIPNISLALTTGPSQPEVQSFEPVGTTDMVDMFSGDFVYNIPLMDVEGYPVNISYHGGVTMEQEASWVGLGWNINPGEINRIVRGIPDDFNGETISKELHIKDEKTLRVGIGGGIEVVGLGDPVLGLSAQAGINLNSSTYRGVSCDFSFGGGVNLFRCASVGVNIGVGSQTGATIDYNAALTLYASQAVSKDIAGGISVSKSGGYNTRSGIKETNFNISLFAKTTNPKKRINTGSSISFTKVLPIAMQNFVPVITNSSTMTSIYGRIKIGSENYWLHPYGVINGMISNLHFNNDGSRDAYGYMYLQNSKANNGAILDFTRDKDGMFNKSMQYLPSAALTYDVYNISGQGTGGMFRPYRNDFGSVFDPKTYSTGSSNSVGLEYGIGNIFELGVDYTRSGTEITSGPWQKYQRDYTDKTPGSIYENVYFKQAGELTSVDPAYLNVIGGMDAITPDKASILPDTKPNSASKRDARGNLIYYFTGAEASISGVGFNSIVSYDQNDFSANPAQTLVPRSGTKISSIVQLQEDGKRYVFGLPATNNIQKEVTFSVNPDDADIAAGLVNYTPGVDDAVTNSKGMDNYYSSSVTPAYAHSFLLTSVLSTDYVDVKGDGPTDDDMGSYTQLKYTRTESDYRWKAPFFSNRAQYNPGFWSEKRDDKGIYVSGSREQWALHSIESKNFIAEFYTSQRNDGLGSTDLLVRSGTYAVAPYDTEAAVAATSFKLDSIKLYNKHDRFINGSNAIPIKTVFFVYDYSLCEKIPNTLPPGEGKLTLKKIYFRYGNSERSMISPYQFEYGGIPGIVSGAPVNPDYNLANKDRWGNFKPNHASFTNYEFPYVDQNDTSNDNYANAWSLSSIKLPSGGLIVAQYESDDYAFVQDKPAQEMFMINGVGSGPEFTSGNQLYHNKSTPYLYAYFKRRLSSENPGRSFKDNYLTDPSCLYYNFNVKLAEKTSTYEPIRGYASIETIGTCSDGIHGYIKFKAVSPTGGGAHLHPVAYTALNVGRYNLPQIIFPGSDPDESSMHNILAGLWGSFQELVSMTKSPIIRLINKGQAQNLNLDKSYVRLQCVGLRKKGGGQRVRALGFYDSWNEMTGSSIEQSASYGKAYDYTINEPGYGKISSGVASYEPLIGGDENPYRAPVKYLLAPGSNWPPNDPVDVYQETPMGETLFPPGSVGYSKVTVSSIHADIGKSSQGIDEYQFYTARDFPVQVKTTTINVPEPTMHFDLFNQWNAMEATQGYCLIFNDMHGKPKSIEHKVYYPVGGTTKLISSQTYNYKQSDGKLVNDVSCLEYQSGTGMTVTTKKLGIEADLTIDTREKNEVTRNFTINTNLNVSSIGPYAIPIPLVFPWAGNYSNQFKCATVTKVIQQYGILDNVRSYNEGAITTVKNEVFDAETGGVIVTSVNNEYQDKEYSVNIPAYWAYTGMAPSYQNIKYEFIADTIFVDSNYMGRIRNASNLHVGDELFLDGSVHADGLPLLSVAWVMGSKNIPSITPADTVLTVDTLYENGEVHYVKDTVIHPGTTSYICEAYVMPRYPKNTFKWDTGNILPGIRVMVLRSGALNMIGDLIESYTTMNNPIASGFLLDSVSGLINITARTFCDSNTRFIHNYIVNPDTVNPYSLGERGVYRLLSEYTYLGGRAYTSSSVRRAGLFSAKRLFTDAYDNNCIRFPYNYLMPNATPSPMWKTARTVTKWSPNGKEVENVDAIGNYSTAVYEYNEALPVAVASNAKQGDIFSEGFEDYTLLHFTNSITNFDYSRLKQFYTPTSIVSSIYDITDITTGPAGTQISSQVSHTGMYSLMTPGGSTITAFLKINNNSYSGITNHTNTYYPPGYTFTSANEYLPFGVIPGRKYILSYWVNDNSPSTIASYSLASNCGVLINGSTLYPITYKTNLIDGWQQVEVVFNVPTTVSVVALKFPAGFYIDDIRIFPYDANMKGFVYNPVNEKLMASLDENNFATMYEYDQEGNLIRTKKETEKGIMTISESRSQNQLQK